MYYVCTKSPKSREVALSVLFNVSIGPRSIRFIRKGYFTGKYLSCTVHTKTKHNKKKVNKYNLA